jgi:hypothetical protein
MCLCIVLGQWGCAEVWATTIYSYIDDQGNPVFTDAPETIPEKYRAKVKTHERLDPVSKSPSMLQSIRQNITEQSKNYGWNMPSFQSGTKPLNVTESPILNYAGIAAIILLLIMYFSKDSPMIRLLALGLLFVIGIGTPVLMYTSDGGPLDTMKKKAAASGQAQQDRLQQVPR